MSHKRVAIIGGGASGLTAIKCCLDEGLEPVCFEKQTEIGGLWNYSEEPKHGTGSVYNSCVINTSKDMFAFSDFSAPVDFPPFMPHRFVLRYLRMYANHFGLKNHIRFSTGVAYVRKAPKYAENGRWEVGHRKSEDEEWEIHTDIFDAVMICTGHHVFPTIPDMPGKDSFQGIQMHSRDYKIPEPFRNKNVLVVGKFIFLLYETFNYYSVISIF
jgi:dimethylaniline monooxygenase (N-oxide forming)